VATLAFLFESDAASNAHLFGGRGHGLRVVNGGAFGTVTPDAAAQQIRSLSGGRVGVLPLVTALANFNSGGVAVSLDHGTDGGIEFAPVASGVGSSFEVHWKGARQLENAIESADLMPQDLLLLDVSIQGKAYVLAISAKSLDLRTPEGQKASSETMREFTQAIRSYPIRVSNPPIHIC
jgi:hypothetical protein